LIGRQARRTHLRAYSTHSLSVTVVAMASLVGAMINDKVGNNFLGDAASRARPLRRRGGQAATLSNYPPLHLPRLSISRDLLIRSLSTFKRSKHRVSAPSARVTALILGRDPT
jgi:hypothetical protein